MSIQHSSTPVRASAYFGWKGLVDRPLAAILLILFAPIIGLLWLLVRLTSSGPGFYRQPRAGLFGRTFVMLKLRSMCQNAEAVTGAVWSSPNDARVTRLGRVLRTFHLDELPQLWNVLKGEMALVGPRPERPEFVEVLVNKIEGYRNRLLVPPGITGLSQLNLPPDSDLDSVARKLVLDLEYVQQAGPWLEARLLMCTATRLFKVPSIRLLGVRRSVNVPARIMGRELPSCRPASDGDLLPMSNENVSTNGLIDVKAFSELVTQSGTNSHASSNGHKPVAGSRAALHPSSKPKPR